MQSSTPDPINPAQPNTTQANPKMPDMPATGNERPMAPTENPHPSDPGGAPMKLG